jgi:vancomycin resistance protein YoaR
MLYAAASDGGTTRVELPTVRIEDDGGKARADEWGIRELVASFTTRHACCAGRVANIHRIADLVRGQVIEPGETFSVNDFIGRRTRANGFVAAGVIQSGHFTDQVGGGISQFATTTFNAAFFAGLDIDEYQSHSIYISRYPYGREATLSFPLPDLELTNNTPYAVMLWPTYTGTSITVDVWSTKYFEVEQTRQTSYKIGRCTRVNTYRSRTAPDGTVIDDMYFATYRPGEGLDCNGNPTPDPER